MFQSRRVIKVTILDIRDKNAKKPTVNNKNIPENFDAHCTYLTNVVKGIKNQISLSPLFHFLQKRNSNNIISTTPPDNFTVT